MRNYSIHWLALGLSLFLAYVGGLGALANGGEPGMIVVVNGAAAFYLIMLDRRTPARIVPVLVFITVGVTVGSCSLAALNADPGVAAVVLYVGVVVTGLAVLYGVGCAALRARAADAAAEAAEAEERRRNPPRAFEFEWQQVQRAKRAQVQRAKRAGASRRTKADRKGEDHD